MCTCFRFLLFVSFLLGADHRTSSLNIHAELKRQSRHEHCRLQPPPSVPSVYPRDKKFPFASTVVLSPIIKFNTLLLLRTFWLRHVLMLFRFLVMLTLIFSATFVSWRNMVETECKQSMLLYSGQGESTGASLGNKNSPKSVLFEIDNTHTHQFYRSSSFPLWSYNSHTYSVCVLWKAGATDSWWWSCSSKGTYRSWKQPFHAATWTASRSTTRVSLKFRLLGLERKGSVRPLTVWVRTDYHLLVRWYTSWRRLCSMWKSTQDLVHCLDTHPSLPARFVALPRTFIITAIVVLAVSSVSSPDCFLIVISLRYCSRKTLDNGQWNIVLFASTGLCSI